MQKKAKSLLWKVNSWVGSSKSAIVPPTRQVFEQRLKKRSEFVSCSLGCWWASQDSTSFFLFYADESPWVLGKRKESVKHSKYPQFLQWDFLIIISWSFHAELRRSNFKRYENETRFFLFEFCLVTAIATATTTTHWKEKPLLNFGMVGLLSSYLKNIILFNRSCGCHLL